MRKILFIIDTLGLGGAEKHLVTILEELKGFELHLIVLRPPYTLESQIPGHVKLTLCRFQPNRQFIRIPLFIRKYIRENKIDIVHSHLYWPNVWSRLGTPRSVTLINHIHSLSSRASYTLNRRTLWLEKFTYRKRHRIVGVSREVLRDFDEWVGLKGPSNYIYNNVENIFFKTEPKSGISTGTFRLVAVGKLDVIKNYGYLIKAFRQMPPGISLDVYGDGEMRDGLQKDIDQDKLPIRLCGNHNEIHLILPQYDAFVMPSLFEGFSLALMEAMASCLPAVISDVPVLREAGGDVAMYFDLNDPGDAVRKVIALKENPGEYVRLSKLSRQRAFELASKDVFMKNIQALYQEQPVTHEQA